MTRCFAALAALTLALPLLADEARIAIIIDDVGYRQSEGRRAVSLPGPVAVAVLPAAPRASLLARSAHASGKEVLVHLPLQATASDGLEEPDSIMLDTTRQEFAQAFAAAAARVPYARGVNNHRGSLITRHPGHMRWLMEEIRDREDWFFVDSYTTHHSVALTIAEEHAVPAAKRDVFLDSHRGAASIEQEFERLKDIARRQGAAIGIGHPLPETLAFLEVALPELEAEGIRLVSLSEILEPSSTSRNYHPLLGQAAATP
jgi:polysaccharide deacetylase 2 family uncharacterized protein YibQ